MRGEKFIERCDALFAIWQIDDVMLWQQPGERRVHAVLSVTHCHRVGCVAVITVLEGNKLATATHAAIGPILYRHFERDLDRDRAGIGKKYAREPAWQK